MVRQFVQYSIQTSRRLVDMKNNKFYFVFVVLFVCSVGAFQFFKWQNGGFNDPLIEKKSKSMHKLKGVYLQGSFDKEEDAKRFDAIERSLIQDHGLTQVSVFYYQNPTQENHQAFQLFIGEELQEGSAMLPDTFEIRKIQMENVLVGTQDCSPTYHVIPDAMEAYLEKSCEGASVCDSLKQDSIFEQYSRNSISVEMLLK